MLLKYNHYNKVKLHFTLGVADAIRTSLGPKGMDKMVSNIGLNWRIRDRVMHAIDPELRR